MALAVLVKLPLKGTTMSRYGEVTYQGQEYLLQDDAQLSNRVFPGWWGDAHEGEEYTAEYSAPASRQSHTNTVVWQFSVVKGQEPENESDYDWDDDNIVRVKALD